MPEKFFPPGGAQLLDGGLNDKYAVSIIENNESPDCLNVIFESGSVGTRRGTSKVNTTSVGSFACDGIYSYRNNSNAESMCAFFGGLMYTLSGTTFYTVPSAQSVFTAGARIASEQDENYIFFCNGSTVPAYKYNGAFTRHGVPAPTQTLAVASNGVGNLTASGNYLYCYSYVNTNVVEGNVGPQTATFTISATSGQNTVSNFGTSPVSYGCNNMYLYRTKANSLTPFYRITTLTVGTATYNDNIADSAISIQAPTDNGVPPCYSTIVYAQTRLFCNDVANPNRLCYSEVGNPYTFKSSSFFLVGDNTSDLVKAVASYDNSIIIFCERSVWYLYMPDATPGNWVGPIRSKSSYGSKSPYCILPYNNKLMFPAVWNQVFVGFAAFAGNVLDTNKTFLTVSTTGGDLKSDGIEPDIYNVQSTYLANISGIVFKKKAWIAVTYNSPNTTNNRVYQMDFSMSNIKKDQEMSWCPFDGIHASQFVIYGANLYFGTSDATGFVYKTDVTALYADDGAAINSYIWTKEYSGDASDLEMSQTTMVKDFRYMNVLVDMAGAYYMNLTYRVDSDKGSGQVIPVSLNPNSTTWGSSMVWGVSTWGGGTNQSEQRVFLQNARGRRIQYKFDNQNTANQRFNVHWFNFMYNLKGYR